MLSDAGALCRAGCGGLFSGADRESVPKKHLGSPDSPAIRSLLASDLFGWFGGSFPFHPLKVKLLALRAAQFFF